VSGNAIPTVDLGLWRTGGEQAGALATEIDVALQRAGFPHPSRS
jgi:hypothetical protein